jgi:hypothetical protein
VKIKKVFVSNAGKSEKDRMLRQQFENAETFPDPIAALAKIPVFSVINSRRDRMDRTKSGC